MVRKHPDTLSKESAAFGHNPFAGLAKASLLAAKAPSPASAPVKAPAPRAPSVPLPKIGLRHESVGRSGKVVTRITGVPRELLETIAARLGKALGCSARVDDVDVILEGSLSERAGAWLQQIGDLRKLTDERPAPPKSATPIPAAPPLIATAASGTYRRNLRPGMKVAIVLKEDQPTGELTTGIVRDLLTSSDEHPRGIKVRLQSGQVGRVKVIYA